MQAQVQVSSTSMLVLAPSWFHTYFSLCLLYLHVHVNQPLVVSINQEVALMSNESLNNGEFYFG